MELLRSHFAKIAHKIPKSKNFSKRTCKANAAGENSSFIFTVCVKSVPHYHFKLAYVVLQMAVKEFFKTHTLLRRVSPTVQAKTREKKKAEKQLLSNMLGVEQRASAEESAKPTKKWRNRPF